jgi:hypothetical protein
VAWCGEALHVIDKPWYNGEDAMAVLQGTRLNVEHSLDSAGLAVRPANERAGHSLIRSANSVNLS